VLYHLSHAGLESLFVQFGSACLVLVLVGQSDETTESENTETLKEDTLHNRIKSKSNQMLFVKYLLNNRCRLTVKGLLAGPFSNNAELKVKK
jgi:hypothetical protein